MARVRNVAGGITIDIAKAKRKCHSNSKHTILPGEAHLVQKTGSVERQNICKECAGPILSLALEHLTSLKKQLGL